MAHGRARGDERVEMFQCRALNESGISLMDLMGSIENDVTLNYCGKFFSIENYFMHTII